MAQNATNVTTGKVRLSYVNIWEPRAMKGDENGKKAYSVTVLIPKTDTKTISDIKKAIDAAAQAGLQSKFGGKMPPVLKTTLKDADVDVNKDGELLANADENTKGHMVITVSRKEEFGRPGIVDENVQAILDPQKIYSGCYGRVAMNFYAYNHPSGGKGVSAGLQHVQFLEDGEPFTAQVSAEAAFAN